ncbi:MAG: respiratory nitrate reductase subunit gamma [Nitrospirota bacterium]
MSNLQWFLVIFGWFSVLVFAVGVAYKAIKFSTMPQNLRWEVYPVPHEEREKRHYGGSYMEEIDWAKKPLHTSLAGEIAEMGSEIFFLKRVREYNPFGLWPFSMAMHWGMYLLFTWIFLLLVEVILKVSAISPITNIAGIVAFISGAFGCLTLILKRATNSELSLYTAPVDYFNLLFMLSIFGTGILSWITDSSLINSRKYVEGIIFFNLSDVPPIVILNFLLFELFLIYMPFTKLLHYVAKYFNFHQSLWDDAFKDKGSPKDKRNLEQVGYKFFWAGPHSLPNKTWLENAQDLVLEEKKK